VTEITNPAPFRPRPHVNGADRRRGRRARVAAFPPRPAAGDRDWHGDEPPHV